ncbi:Ig-like domain-containing protein [Treponema sp.]|uniref:Ig-like domain-containing protein n=1 Tax=Treponema sp. TaxID=166 RepID=UPI00257E7D22|nr:Ig-like domain-containing protein [Treponema sp.]
MANCLKSFLAGGLIMLVCFFTSCDVGLGESVDTVAPSVEITYPPANSVIRGAFEFAGTCSDDKGVSSVSVTVLGTDRKAVRYTDLDGNSKEYAVPAAKVENDGKTWHILINEQISEGAYPLSDGTYICKVQAKDSSGRTSDWIERSFEIDNTEPVFIISSPAVTDTANATEYGSVFKISGKIADDHDIRKMNVTVYDKDGKIIEGNDTWTYTNVDTAGGMSITAARYFTKSGLSAAEQTLHNNYINIYGEGYTGDKIFTCTVELEDAAQEWVEPVYKTDLQPENIARGNVTTSLWLNDDIYEELMGANSAYQLEAGGIKKIWNGTDDEPAVLSILQDKRKDTAETKLAFSLNKKAEPTYSIGGYDMTGADFSGNSAAKNGKITFMANAGRNGIQVDPSTFTLYLFGPFEPASVDESFINGLYSKPAEKYNQYHKEQDSQAEILYSGADYKKGSVEAFTQTVTLPESITNGSRYIFAATGSDLDGLTLETSEGTFYGFTGIAAGTPPQVTISFPDDDAVIKSSEGLFITGTASSTESKIKEISYEITVYDYLKKDSGGNYIKVGTVTGFADAVENTRFGETPVKYSCDVSKGTFVSADKDKYPSANPSAEYDNKKGQIFVYEIVVVVRDDSASESNEKRRIYLDNAKPVPLITNVDPVAEKQKDENGNIVEKKINGTVTISGKVTEKNLKSLVLTVKDSAEKTETHTYSEASFEEKIDTTLFSDGEVVFTLTAVDEAGNESSASEKYTVDQTTDKPVIKFSNGKSTVDGVDDFSKVVNGQNIFGVENNNKALFSFTDDDGLEEIKITLCDEYGAGISLEENNDFNVQIQDGRKIAENPVIYTPDGSASYSVSYILPQKEGKYILDIEVIDVECKNVGDRQDAETVMSYRKSTAKNYIVVSESNFVMKFADSKIVNDECEVKLEDTTVEGTISVTDLDKIKSIERYIIVQNESGVSEKKVLSFYKKDESGGITISLPENSSKVRWTETISAGQLTEGENHFYYLAEDVTGNHTELELMCYADNTPPSVRRHSDTEKIVDKWLNSRTQTLTYIVQDAENNSYASGIDSVKYSFKNGESTTEGYFARGDSCDENGNTKAETKDWILYKTTFDLPEGESNLVTVTVADRVGNTSFAKLNLKIDTNAPVVSVTPSITGGQILQNTKEVPVTFAYEDATSGIQKVEFDTDSNMSKNVVSVTDFTSPYNYSLSGLKDGTYSIYVRATDNAGNKSEAVKAGEVIVDTTAPKVEIKTPVSGATVNKTISFAGMVTDNNLPDGSVPVLWYNDGTTGWTPLSSGTPTLSGQDWTITGVDTTKLNDTIASKDFEFRVVFTDKAGNSNDSVEKYPYKLKIDQNADRPEIKLTNINTTGSSISSNLVQGVISDDDGVSTKGGVKLYRIDSADYDADSETNKTPSTSGNKWKPIPVEAGTGIWKAEIAEAEGQGSKHWYFYVIDEAGGEFCTKSTSQLERPYLTDGSSEKSDNQTGITFFFDTTAPTVKISLSEDGTNYSTTNTIFGGSKDLYVRAEVFEEVGMAEKTATKAPAVLYIGGVKQEKNTPTVIQNGNTYTYKFNSIALSGYPADKPLSVSVTAEDSAGNTNKDILNITIDKDAPTVKIISPTTALSDAVSSSVSIKGIVQDDKSSIAKLEYVIPKNGVEDASQEWKAMGTAASWDITFASGAPDSSDSLIYYAVAENASGGKVYQVEVSGTENIYKVPLWFKVSDSAGNKAIVKDQYVLVDSEGGKPKAWINSPENNATTSGVVTIYGGASDNVSVSKVCVQIDANNDGNFNADDATYINNSWESDKDELKSTIAGSGDDWYIPASGTNSWKLNVDTNCISENSGSKTLRIRVKAIDDEGLSRAWSDPVIVNIDSETPVIKNLKLVQYGKDEMPTDSTSPVTEREYVSGMYISNISAQNNGQWYLTGDVSDNVSVSSITFEMITSSTQNNIRLEDGSEIKPGAASYKLRVPLKTDESGVISYAIKAKDNNTGEATVSITINIDSTSPSLYNTSNTETLKPGTSLRLKSMSKTLGTGEENSTVVNNNNFFTFGDVVSESGSGLAYTAFYFERDGSSEKRVYNPMFNSGNKNVIDAESFTAGKVYINGDGLAALCVIDSSRKSEDSITLSSANANIRKGGLIKIAGGYSLITEVSGTTVKFSPTASTTFKQAELILAQVVDHKITESVGSDGKTVVNDDGDEMIETINQIGSSYNWTASIDSNNIPDGPVTIHVVAIDNAGNSTHGSIATKVENNRPRIAKVLLGTDLNDSGKYDFVADSAPVTTGDNEKDTKDGKAFGEFSYFTALDSNSGKAKSEVTLTSSAFKVIKGLCIIPEFVGGNNGLGYILENPSDLSNAGYETGSVSSMTTKDGILANVNSTGIYQIDNEISRFGGIELTSLTSGNISITFWDKTEETVQGTNSQWALLKIPVTLMTDEKESPVPVINPFYWKDSTDNSVYIDGKIKGHIELEGDLTNDIIKSLGNDPKVSGKIKIEGTVTDNVRISSVKMSFASLFAEQQLASYTKGVWNISSLPQGVEKFEIEDVYISQEGHKAKYILVVDTEKLTGVTGKDKAITISATDWTDSNTSAAVSYTVDVVPYVTEIVTNLSSYSMDNPSVYARSSVGSYPVYEGEEIEIKGYNIGEGIASVAMNGKTVTLNSSNKLTVDSNVSSGTVSVSVEGISAVNNLNKNDAIGSYSGSASDNDYANCYNRQPNGVNNNLLTDDLSLDVWNFKTAASPIGSSANYVHMKVGPYLSNDSANSGRIGFSFKNAIGYFNMPGQKSGNSYTVTNNSVDLYVNSSLDYIAIHHWGNSDKNKTEVPISLGSAVSYKGGSYYHISFSSSDLDITSSGDTTLQFLLTKKVGDYTDKTGDCMITRVGCYVIDSVPNGTINPTTEYRTSTVGNKVFSQTRFGTNYGGFNHNTFAFDKNGYTYGAAQCPDTSGKDGMSANFQFFSRAVSDESSDYHGLNFNYFNVTNGRRIENTSYYKDSTVYTDENRVQNPEMATYVSESTSYVYLAYYDHGLDMIKFRVGSVGSSANSIGLGLQDLDKFTSNKYSENDANKICKDNGNLKDSLDNTYVGDQGDAYKYVTNIAASGASPYVAVGALPTDGTAVVVWYDKNVQALKMKTATFSSVTSTTVSWTDRGIISSVGGKYVSMATDEAGGIHLAYLSNSGANLYYTYMSSVSAKPVTMLVDAYQDVGDRCMITVGRESTSKPWIPYISYKSNYASHTKIAYPVFADDADAATRPTSGIENGTEKYTGAWNVSLVPDTSLSIDDTVSIGVNKDWTSDSGVMYNFPTGETQKASDTGVYALCDATIVYGNGTKNPVMGYAIEDGSIQMAQKK